MRNFTIDILNKTYEVTVTTIYSNALMYNLVTCALVENGVGRHSLCVDFSKRYNGIKTPAKVTRDIIKAHVALLDTKKVLEDIQTFYANEERK